MAAARRETKRLALSLGHRQAILFPLAMRVVRGWWSQARVSLAAILGWDVSLSPSPAPAAVGIPPGCFAPRRTFLPTMAIVVCAPRTMLFSPPEHTRGDAAGLGTPRVGGSGVRGCQAGGSRFAIDAKQRGAHRAAPGHHATTAELVRPWAVGGVNDESAIVSHQPAFAAS
jgi:hypothetical protein